LNEIGSCALARGFANTGSPCKDASAIFWNPAALTTLSGWNVTAGAASIALKGTFEQDTTGRLYESDIPTAIVPHLFLNYHPALSKLALGLGVYVPYGLTSQWTNDFPGRFQAQKASLQTIYVQPNLAYQLTSKWSIGAGPVFGFRPSSSFKASTFRHKQRRPERRSPSLEFRCEPSSPAQSSRAARRRSARKSAFTASRPPTGASAPAT
jgi:long-subunit fatty acid transport protein